MIKVYTKTDIGNLPESLITEILKIQDSFGRAKCSVVRVCVASLEQEPEARETMRALEKMFDETVMLRVKKNQSSWIGFHLSVDDEAEAYMKVEVMEIVDGILNKISSN